MDVSFQHLEKYFLLGILIEVKNLVRGHGVGGENKGLNGFNKIGSVKLG